MANGIIIRPLGQLVQALSRYGQTLYQPPKDTISGVSPEAWYSPLQPIRPIGPPGVEPRGFQYWAGQNLLWTPRADAEYSAARLKQLASYPLARIAIENVKDALCKANWEIQPRPKPGEPRKAAVKRGFDDQNLLKLSRFFEAPDREHSWPEWLRPLLEDMLVIDAWTILIRKTFNGEIVELPTLRGESIVRYIDDNGFTPMPPDPAYAQNWWGIPLVDLTTDQCIYKPRNIVPRNTIASQLYGMCYDSETEILTRDRGFVRFAELRQSDSVATRHPETAELEWQKPSAYINRPYEGEMYAFTSQSMDVLVTPEHRMLVSIPTKGQNGRNEKIMGAADLAEGINQGRKIPVTSEWNGGTGVSEVVFAKTDYRGQEIRISGDDFCALLGAYLAEGNLRTAGGIEIAQGSESKGFSPYSALMRRINLTGEDGYNGKAFTCSYRALSEYFRQFGVSHEKFVPDIIRNAPRRQLQIFWDYFMLGDGSSVVRENKSGRGDPGREREEATTTSLRLSDHLVEIAQKLGFSASVHVRPARYAKVAGNEKLSFCRESYHVRCRYSSEMAVGAAKIPYTGMVHCVTVPNGIVYIRRNGKPCWSGNSPTEQLAPEIEIGMKRLEFTLAYYTEGSIPGVVQVIPRGTPNEKISEAMQWMNSELAGNLSARRQWRMVQGFQEPGKTDQIIFAKEPLLADPFDELHIRKISFGYGISPQRMMRMMNRASAQASQEASEIEGLLPYFASLKSLIDFIIQRKFNYPDYEIVFDPFTEPDPEKEANRLKTLVASAMMTPNEGRAKLGEEARKEPEADQLGVITGSGFVPLGSQGAGLQPGEVKPSDVPDGKPDGAGKKPDEELEAEGGEAEPARGKQPASPRKPASANKSDGHGLALEASATPSPRDIGFVSGAVIAPPVAPIELEKYSENQARDERGRFTSDGGTEDQGAVKVGSVHDGYEFEHDGSWLIGPKGDIYHGSQESWNHEFIANDMGYRSVKDALAHDAVRVYTLGEQEDKPEISRDAGGIQIGVPSETNAEIVHGVLRGMPKGQVFLEWTNKEGRLDSSEGTKAEILRTLDQLVPTHKALCKYSEDQLQIEKKRKAIPRDRPAIRPGRLASASILGKLRLEKVLLKRFKTMRRKTVKLTAAALKLPHEHLEKYSPDQPRDERGRFGFGSGTTATNDKYDFPIAGKTVDGLEVGEQVDNTSSIGASMLDYEIRDDIREVPFSAFEDTSPSFYSRTERERVEELAAEIKESGRVDPLIVVVDKKGPWVLEGGHRFDALILLGHKSFPALVVDDLTPEMKLRKSAESDIAKYSEDQARDDQGRWTDGGGSSSGRDPGGKIEAEIDKNHKVDARFAPMVQEMRDRQVEAVLAYLHGAEPLAEHDDGKYRVVIMNDAERSELTFKEGDPHPVPSGKWMDFHDDDIAQQGYNAKEYRALPEAKRAEIDAKVQVERYVAAQYEDNREAFYHPKEHEAKWWAGKAAQDFVKVSFGYLIKAGADKTARQILDALAMEWEYVAREAAGPLADAALAGASIGGLQLEISSADMLDSINTVARDWAADRAAEMVGMQRTEDGKLIPNPDAKWAISDTTRENLRDVVTGLFDAEGELSLRDVETAIEDAGIFSDTRATMIANTEISRAQTEGNREAWRQSGVVEKVDVVVSAMHDLEDECDEAAAGSPYDLEDAPDIPLHPNCCLPGTLVSAGGRIAAQMSRWYEGEVITLRIEGMDELTVTPNHPVLTDHGWVLAGQLEQGMNLVSCGTPGSTSSIIGPHDEDVPTRIEEIADSLLKSGGMFTSGVPTSAEDFHGDGIIDGKVDVVWAASFLRGDWNIAEGAGEITLQPRSVGLAGFHAPSFSAQLVESVVGTTPSNMGSSGSGLAFSRRAPLGFGAPGFMEVPDGESMSREEFADRDAVDSAGLGDVHATFPEQVSFVKLLGVGRSKFAGHIYNLTTEFGWYSANGIITHNCECSLILSEIGEGESAEEE